MLKQHYLSAVIGYITASGFHSLHEILGPAQYALNLVPGYEIQAPDMLQDKLAPAPHYHHYFELISIIDNELGKLVEETWRRYLQYFEKIYLQQAAVSERLQGSMPLMELVKASDNTGYAAGFFQIRNLCSEVELQQSAAIIKSPRF
jgi:hypothetical protein